jgi:phospholipid/cholesterol/gamma-HCH transport system permease protein
LEAARNNKRKGSVAAKLIETRGADGVALFLSGRLDAYSIAAVWAGARQALDRHRTVPVTVDAAGVEYCDGAGVALLLILYSFAVDVIWLIGRRREA